MELDIVEYELSDEVRRKIDSILQNLFFQKQP